MNGTRAAEKDLKDPAFLFCFRHQLRSLGCECLPFAIALSSCALRLKAMSTQRRAAEHGLFRYEETIVEFSPRKFAQASLFKEVEVLQTSQMSPIF